MREILLLLTQPTYKIPRAKWIRKVHNPPSNILMNTLCVLQGPAKKRFPGCENFVLAVAYHHFCLALPEKFSQPGNHSFAGPCSVLIVQLLSTIFSASYRIIPGSKWSERRWRAAPTRSSPCAQSCRACSRGSRRPWNRCKKDQWSWSSVLYWSKSSRRSWSSCGS